MSHRTTSRSKAVLAAAVLAAAACQAPLPSATLEPSPVPQPSAWLLGYDDQGVTLYDAATGEQIELSLPPLWMPEQDLRGIRNSGLTAARIATDQETGSDLALAIIRLPQGDILRRIPLFSDYLTDRIRSSAGSLLPDYELEDLRGAVDSRWFEPRWSPDNTKIAFAAALQDTGADLYIYDLLRDDLKRLTDEVDQAVALGWSPDGEWVLYSEVFGFADEDYFPTNVNAVSVRTGEVRQLFEPISSLRIAVVGWPADDEVVLVGVDPYGQVLFDLYRVSLTSGEAVLLYDKEIGWVDLDPVSGTLALTTMGDLGGLAVMRSGQSPEPVRAPWRDALWAQLRWYPELGRFYAESDLGVLAITPDGAPAADFESEGCTPLPSPDGRWLAFGPCVEGWFPQAGLRIYTAAGELIRELEADYVEAAVWGPGSEGLYYLMYGADGLVLKWAQVPSGPSRIVDQNARALLTLIQPGESVAQLALSLPTEAPTMTPGPTLAPSPTPVRALDPGGPWLVGMTDHGPVAMNPDGTGLTELFAKAVLDRSAGWLDAEISSAGWVAAIGGGSSASLIIGRPGAGAVRQLPILSPELAAEMDQRGESGQPKAWTEDVYLALDADGFIDTLSWSPDGRTLAYVAAVDGLSADLYVYDTATDEVRRLTDGPNQPKILGWSADGRWVLHLEIADIQLGDGVWWDTLGLWAAAADGSEVRKVPSVEGPVALLHWGTPTRFMVVHYDHGPLPPYQLDLIDLNSGPVQTIYSGSFYQWAVDPATSTLAFLVDPNFESGEETLERGLYLASPTRPSPRLVVSPRTVTQPDLVFAGGPEWSPELNAFLIAASDRSVTFVSPAGETLRYVEDKCSLPMASPDGRWLAFESCSRIPPGIEVWSEEDGRVMELSLGDVGGFFWGPDSGGIYYFLSSDPAKLMYAPVPWGEPRLIHPSSGLRGGWWLPRFAEGP